VAAGMGSLALGYLLLAQLTIDTSYWYLLFSMIVLTIGLALTMSPLTAAIMSAVPPSRAGAGSAMNDASREIGASLGVAVLGSLSASRYGSGVGNVISSLSGTDRSEANTSLAGALKVASHLPADAAARLTTVARDSFVSGIHFASLIGAGVALAASALVLRYLPRHVEHHGGEMSGTEALEDTAEMGLGGVAALHLDGADLADSVVHNQGAST
jgi:hypothetical protein